MKCKHCGKEIRVCEAYQCAFNSYIHVEGLMLHTCNIDREPKDFTYAEPEDSNESNK